MYTEHIIQLVKVCLSLFLLQGYRCCQVLRAWTATAAAILAWLFQRQCVTEHP